MTTDYQNLYLHVPFCNGKCDYCAFYSEPECDPGKAALWLRKIRQDAAEEPLDSPLHTVYIGGGTPTVLPPEILAELMDFLHTLPLVPEAEISCECNPGSLTKEKAEILSGTVTRISMGAQSFHPELLRAIGRRTNPDMVIRTFDLLRETGINQIGLDLICALPGETLNLWEEDLQQAMKLQPDHVSAYMLIPEPGTPFVRKYGEKPPCSEESQTQMWELAGTFLADHGLFRYEISNHALPGRECRHNQNIWHGETYLGLGPAACSFDGILRKTNASPLADWLSGQPPEIDSIPEAARKREIFMMGLRTVRGWNRTEFDWSGLLSVLRELEKDGLLEITEQYVRPTARGLLCWDTIAEMLV